MRRSPILLVLPLLLAACSGGPPADNVQGAVREAGPGAGGDVAGPVRKTAGGDRSQITLAALQPEDIETIDGELGCSFVEREDGPTVLIGRADVGKDARAYAAVRNGGVLETLSAPGGFGAMENGASFVGKGLTIRIAPLAKVATGHEGTAQRATLTVQRADGAERRLDGL
jgi:hypothetical protein